MTRPLLALALASLALPALAEEDHHAARVGAVEALHAWAAATTGPEALVFVEFANAGDTPARLTGAETDLADTATLVGFAMVDGAGRYLPLEAVEIPAKGRLTLAPEAVALQLTGLRAPLVAGAEVEVSWRIDGQALPMHVQIEPEGATQHGHAGHSH